MTSIIIKEQACQSMPPGPQKFTGSEILFDSGLKCALMHSRRSGPLRLFFKSVVVSCLTWSGSVIGFALRSRSVGTLDRAGFYAQAASLRSILRPERSFRQRTASTNGFGNETVSVTIQSRIRTTSGGLEMRAELVMGLGYRLAPFSTLPCGG